MWMAPTDIIVGALRDLLAHVEKLPSIEPPTVRLVYNEDGKVDLFSIEILMHVRNKAPQLLLHISERNDNRQAVPPLLERRQPKGIHNPLLVGSKRTGLGIPYRHCNPTIIAFTLVVSKVPEPLLRLLQLTNGQTEGCGNQPHVQRRQ
jgi:hypothetical protein